MKEIVVLCSTGPKFPSSFRVYYPFFLFSDLCLLVWVVGWFFVARSSSRGEDWMSSQLNLVLVVHQSFCQFGWKYLMSGGFP